MKRHLLSLPPLILLAMGGASANLAAFPPDPDRPQLPQPPPNIIDVIEIEEDNRIQVYLRGTHFSHEEGPHKIIIGNKSLPESRILWVCDSLVRLELDEATHAQLNQPCMVGAFFEQTFVSLMLEHGPTRYASLEAARWASDARPNQPEPSQDVPAAPSAGIHTHPAGPMAMARGFNSPVRPEAGVASPDRGAPQHASPQRKVGGTNELAPALNENELIMLSPPPSVGFLAGLAPRSGFSLPPSAATTPENAPRRIPPASSSHLGYSSLTLRNSASAPVTLLFPGAIPCHDSRQRCLRVKTAVPLQPGATLPFQPFDLPGGDSVRIEPEEPGSPSQISFIIQRIGPNLETTHEHYHWDYCPGVTAQTAVSWSLFHIDPAWGARLPVTGAQIQPDAGLLLDIPAPEESAAPPPGAFEEAGPALHPSQPRLNLQIILKAAAAATASAQAPSRPAESSSSSATGAGVPTAPSNLRQRPTDSGREGYQTGPRSSMVGMIALDPADPASTSQLKSPLDLAMINRLKNKTLALQLRKGAAHTSAVQKEDPESIAQPANTRRFRKWDPDQCAPLQQWFQAHLLSPYPSELEKVALARQSGISLEQLNNWFINNRMRHWKPKMRAVLAANRKAQSQKKGKKRPPVAEESNEHDSDDPTPRKRSKQGRK